MKTIVYIFVFALIATSIVAIVRTIHGNNLVRNRYSEIPSILLYDSDNKSKKINNFITHNPTVIMLFSIDCDHCEYELKEFENNKDKFVNVNLVFISFDDKNRLFNYFKDRRFFDKKVYYTNVSNIANNFGLKQTPSLFIYNDKNKLIRKINGEVKVLSIFNIINSSK